MSVKCECGCNEAAPLIKKTDARKGWVKGQYARFIAGHYQRMVLTKEKSPALWTDRALIPITENDIENLRTVDDLEAADIYNARTRMIEKTTRSAFVELGMICLEVSRRQLWAKMVDPETRVYFHSIDAWIYSSLNVSRSSAYSAMKVLQTKDIAVRDLMEMPRRNAERLATLSSRAQRDPAIIEAAKGPEKAFAAEVQKRHPDQHFEAKRAVMVTLPDSARSEMEECFEVVRWAYDVMTREDVLSNLFAFFLDGKCEREGYTNWTNREAYGAAKKRGMGR